MWGSHKPAHSANVCVARAACGFQRETDNSRVTRVGSRVAACARRQPRPPRRRQARPRPRAKRWSSPCGTRPNRGRASSWCWTASRPTSAPTGRTETMVISIRGSPFPHPNPNPNPDPNPHRHPRPHLHPNPSPNPNSNPIPNPKPNPHQVPRGAARGRAAAAARRIATGPCRAPATRGPRSR